MIAACVGSRQQKKLSGFLEQSLNKQRQTQKLMIISIKDLNMDTFKRAGNLPVPKVPCSQRHIVDKCTLQEEIQQNCTKAGTPG